MTGKTVVVTGANCGIGYETALELACRNARVILGCRDIKKAQHAADKIIRKTGNQDVEAKHLDLASFTSIRKFCNELNSNLSQLDVLINNAGVMKAPYQLTEDGLETHMAVNHYGNVLLTTLLQDLMRKPDSSRVVFVSSALHKYGTVDLDNCNTEEFYNKGKQYGSSKLMNLLYVRILSEKYAADSRISVYTLSPGMVRTRLGRHSVVFNKYFQIFCFPLYAVLYSLYVLLVKTAREGCQTVVYCAVAPELQGTTGCYYSNCRQEAWSAAAQDKVLARTVYDHTLNFLRSKHQPV